MADADGRERKGRQPAKDFPGERFDLETLVNAISDENRHDLVETDGAVGGEAW